MRHQRLKQPISIGAVFLASLSIGSSLAAGSMVVTVASPPAKELSEEPAPNDGHDAKPPAPAEVPVPPASDQAPQVVLPVVMESPSTGTDVPQPEPSEAEPVIQLGSFEGY